MTERCLGRGRWRLGRWLELAKCSSLPGWGEGITHLIAPLLAGDLEGVRLAIAGDLVEDEDASTDGWKDILAGQWTGDQAALNTNEQNTRLNYLLKHSQLVSNFRQSDVQKK